ncbi:MAG: HalOD1 output domain-containing protein [Halorientalis sp.]
MDEPITADIVAAIADAEGVETTELSFSLAAHIDCDAIRWLDRHESDDWTLSFAVPDHDVTVSGDGTVSIASRPEDAAGD